MKDSTQLVVTKDEGFEIILDGEPALKKGQLDAPTVDELRVWFSDDKVRHYAEGHTDYPEKCTLDGITINWGTGVTACWIREDLKDADTAAMLDYVVRVYERLNR